MTCSSVEQVKEGKKGVIQFFFQLWYIAYVSHNLYAYTHPNAVFLVFFAYKSDRVMCCSILS